MHLERYNIYLIFKGFFFYFLLAKQYFNTIAFELYSGNFPALIAKLSDRCFSI